MVNFNCCAYKPSLREIMTGGKSCCGTPVKIAGTYCDKHGCKQCNYVGLKNIHSNPKKYKIEETRTDYEEEVCSPKCKIKGESKKVGEEADKKRQKLLATVQELDQKLITEIKNTFAPFWEKIKIVRIDELKENFLNQKIKDCAFVALTQSAIDAHASLTDSEREQWKVIYQNVSLIDNLPSLYPLERKFLVSLAEKYKEQEEQARQNNIPECKKCRLRREQPSTWPVGCEGWCKECVEQKQRKKQTPNNNDNYQPPINNSPPTDNQENFPHPQNDSSESAGSQTDSDKQKKKKKREREREREQNLPREAEEPPTTKEFKWN